MSHFFTPLFIAITGFFSINNPSATCTAIDQNKPSTINSEPDTTNEPNEWEPTLEELMAPDAIHVDANGKQTFPFADNDYDGLCTCDDCKAWEANFQASTPEQRKQ